MTELYFPERLEFVDELPRDPAGKLRKYQLRAMFDAGSAPSADVAEQLDV